MKTIGLIGGTSWHSTIVYYQLINEWTGEIIGASKNPPMLIHSLNIELMRSQNRSAINDKYLEVARQLSQGGAEALVICANTPHMVYSYVQPLIDIPILHIADATGKEAHKKGLRKLGLLGNKPTMTGGFIRNRLKVEFNIETLIPEVEAVEQSHHFVSRELTQGQFTEEARGFYRDQIRLLQEKGADGIILGCTELPMLLEDEALGIPLLSTTHLHARMAVDFILQND